MIRKIIEKCVKSLKANYIFRKLAQAEELLDEGLYSEALNTLDTFNPGAFSIDVSLMRAEALIGLKRKKEALKELRHTNAQIADLPNTGQKKKYFNLYNLCLIQQASGEKIPGNTLVNQYNLIKFEIIPNRIRRQFPITFKDIN